MRHKLEFAAPLLGDGKLVGFAGLVFKHLEVDGVTSKLEVQHDAVVGCNAVAVVTGFEGLDEDHGEVGVVREHDVVVAAVRADGEAAHVVSVELAALGLDGNEQFFGALGRKMTGDVGE